MPMNPTYLQAIQMKQQAEQAEQQMQQQAQAAEAQAAQMEQQTQAASGEEADPGQGEPEDNVGAPQYSDSFGKSLAVVHDGKYLEIALDDLDDWKDSVR